MLLVAAHLPPRRDISAVKAGLDRLSAILQQSSLPALIGGDFNAKSTAWGEKATDSRGELVLEWASAAGLVLLNRGTVPTCVRPQGESIVDLTFASPSLAAKISGWQVLVGADSFSNHRYIQFDISASPNIPAPLRALRTPDRDMCREAAEVKAWLSHFSETDQGDEKAQVTYVCHTSTSPEGQVYWWSEEIAELRRACLAARRASSRHLRRRRRDPELDGPLREAYRTAKKTLQVAISKAKVKAREELTTTVVQPEEQLRTTSDPSP
ncbi:hypothetical protein ABMA28_009253 [Loxostege sticticalis]|uniref:Endonuclease/exonuclease/phosphatase domain-containing protein n=1 Tax=Loxostege sticticalis TaxID=481309 RepID=A0ABD0SCN8_LOXSC